jgi:hypothetical protein
MAYEVRAKQGFWLGPRRVPFDVSVAGAILSQSKIPISDPSVGISRHDAAKLKTLLGVVPHSRSWKQQSELEYQCPNLGGKVHDPNTGS